MLGPLLTVAGTSAAAVLVAMLVTAAAARRSGRISVVDTTWGLGFVLVAVVSAVTAATLGEGDPWRTWLITLLVGVWGCRLSWHLHRRNAGKGEDPRYAEMVEARGFGPVTARVLLIQGVVLWMVAWPVQLAAVSEVPSGSSGVVLVVLGAALWLWGITFEAVGDAQLAAYRRSRPPAGGVMSTGLWRYTRHPNYFGDACIWWGIWVLGVSAEPWWLWLLVIVSPALMTYVLVFATGARLLERTMMQRPGYPEYAARTSMFVPLPPRRRSEGVARGPLG